MRELRSPTRRMQYSEFPVLGRTVLADVTIRDEGFETSGFSGANLDTFLEPLPFLGFELDVFNIFGPDVDANRTRTLDVKAANAAPRNVTAARLQRDRHRGRRLNCGSPASCSISSGVCRSCGVHDYPPGPLEPVYRRWRRLDQRPA